MDQWHPGSTSPHLSPEGIGLSTYQGVQSGAILGRKDNPPYDMLTYRLLLFAFLI